MKILLKILSKLKSLSKKQLIIIGSGVGVAILILILAMCLSLFSPASSEDKKVTVDYHLENGMTIPKIGEDLQDAGIIRSANAFYIYARIYKPVVKSGFYHLESSMALKEIFSALSTGAQMQIPVTVKEGLTSRMIAELLDQKEIVSKESFLAAVKDKELLSELNVPSDTAEGYLFPDTYSFIKNMNADDVLKIFVKNFWATLKNNNITVNDIPNFHNTVILASIVEREYQVPEEAPLIAGVFMNRLNKNINLGSCATVVYIITEVLNKPHPSQLFYADLEVDNPYNTYKNSGLPPAPICNPGLIALKAAAKPTKSDFLYFRLTDASAGKHTFTRTLDEHIDAGRLYVKGK